MRRYTWSMATINLDDDTIRKLADLATARGMTIEAFLESLIPRNGCERPLTEQDFDAELNKLSFHGPTLPESFSRADIYFDRD